MTGYGTPFRKRWYFLLLFSFVLINSCKTDFDIIAPYKETTIVYGLLDPDAPIQYIKINKAFLGEGDALVMAQQKDSTNYPAGTLDVKLQRFKSNQVMETIQFDSTTEFAKDPGVFYYGQPNPIIYKANYIPLQDGSTYKLVIYNTRDQKTLTASTPVVGGIDDNDITHPGPGEPINFTAVVSPQYQVLFKAANNGRLYSLVLRFHYTEINMAASPPDTTEKYIDWDHGTQKSQHLNGSEQIAFLFIRYDFYGFVRNRLTVDANIKRLIPFQPIEFRITYAGDDLSTYIDVNQPSISVVQERPEYSNIANGFGIFSSRSLRSLPRKMDAVSEDSLRIGQITKDLNFQ